MLKKIIVMALMISALSCLTVFAGGTPVGNYQVDLYSGQTGTTAQVKSDQAIFDNVVQNFGFTLKSSPTTTVVVEIYGSAVHGGSFTGVSLATATTCAVGECYFAITGKPVYAIQALITSSTSTSEVTLTGAVLQ